MSDDASVSERFAPSPEGLRARTARGVLINGAFQIGFSAITLIQRFAVAAFLTATEYGIWGIVLTTLITLSALKEIGISDKFVQQDEDDQEVAFQKAFTLELALSGIVGAMIVVLLPLYALIYDRSEIILPAAVLSLTLVVGAFSAPIWIAYRQMRFVRQRLLEGVSPIVSTALVISLAASGAGYWSLVVGILGGAVAGSAVAVVTSPYPLRLRFDGRTLREYFRFSWPLLAASGSGLLVVQGTMIVGNYAVGLAGLGALTLANSLLIFARRVDAVISRTIYPAVAGFKDRPNVLFETFVKSNRVAMMWGLPFGFGLLLFAPDLVDFVLGDRWEPAVVLLQGLGVLVGLRQVAFNWGVFINVTGRTRPLAVSGALAVGVFLVATMPLMFAFGLHGYIAGMSLANVSQLALRGHYMSRMFAGFRILRHLARAIAPVLPAVGAVLVTRLAAGGARSLEGALVEFALYVLVVVGATFWFERRLIAELSGYLRRGRSRRPALA